MSGKIPASQQPHGGPSRHIDEIIIGDRHRRDMGDLDAFAADIAEIGLLHPIVIRPDGRLIAGERRLRAAKLAGCDTVPGTVVPIARRRCSAAPEFRNDKQWR
jgi:ParB family chromosome partitioning protein